MLQDSGQVGAQIEVTPQMLEVGLKALDFCRDSADEYEIVCRVYNAMAAQALQPSPNFCPHSSSDL